MIRENLEALFADVKLNLPPGAKGKTATISRSTVERMLKTERNRHKAKGTCATKPGNLLKQQIPVRTFWHWDDKKPGFTEVDTVSHDGGYAEGEYAYTLSLTDVSLCWSRHMPRVPRPQKQGPQVDPGAVRGHPRLLPRAPQRYRQR
jgi:hypothetical protein